MRSVGIRIVYAEDNVLLREGVVRLLGSVPGLEVVGSCGAFDALVSMVGETIPDVVVTDIRMPPTGTDEGIRAANLFRQTHPGVGVVVLSHYADPAYALALLEHGSEQRAYLLKDRVSDTDQLVDAIRVVMLSKRGRKPMMSGWRTTPATGIPSGRAWTSGTVASPRNNVRRSVDVSC